MTGPRSARRPRAPRRRCEVEGDAAGLGLVGAGLGELDDDREAELLRGRDRLLGRRADALRDDRDPVGRRAGRAPRRARASLVAAPSARRRALRGGVDVSSRRHRAAGRRSHAARSAASRAPVPRTRGRRTRGSPARASAAVSLARRSTRARACRRRRVPPRRDGAATWASAVTVGTKRTITASTPGSASTSGSTARRSSSLPSRACRSGSRCSPRRGGRRERARGLVGEGRQLEPCGLARVGAEDSEAAGVRQHGHAAAARRGWLESSAATSRSSSSVSARG